MYVHANHNLFNHPWYISVDIQIEGADYIEEITWYGYLCIIFKMSWVTLDNISIQKEFIFLKMYQTLLPSRLNQIIACLQLVRASSSHAQIFKVNNKLWFQVHTCVLRLKKILCSVHVILILGFILFLKKFNTN
jgi:hypothetical protein